MQAKVARVFQSWFSRMIEPRPEVIHDQFLRCFRERDLDGLLALYEDEATFVTADGTANTGKGIIRETLQALLDTDGDLELETRYAARCGDIALLSNRWRLLARKPGDGPVLASGVTSEVARRQPNGRWLLIVDHPWGGASEA